MQFVFSIICIVITVAAFPAFDEGSGFSVQEGSGIEGSGFDDTLALRYKRQFDNDEKNVETSEAKSSEVVEDSLSSKSESQDTITVATSTVPATSTEPTVPVTSTTSVVFSAETTTFATETTTNEPTVQVESTTKTQVAREKFEKIAEDIDNQALAINEEVKKMEKEIEKIDEDIEKVEQNILDSDDVTDEFKKCEPFFVCHSDNDCNGGKCFGLNLGTCNCNACINFWKCETDADCGGFANACNTNTNMCDCLGAHVKNGVDPLLIFGSFCNNQTCSPDTAAADCHGLPCNTGRCVC